MPGDFELRMDHLLESVGLGEYTISVEFDQAYAHRQHEDMTLKHEHGGGPQFLRRALYEDAPEYMTILSEGVLTDFHAAVKVTAEHFASNAERRAPKRSTGLSGSAHPMVTHNGDIIYDRPPRIGRRSPEEVQAFNMELQDPEHYYGSWPPPIGHPERGF